MFEFACVPAETTSSVLAAVARAHPERPFVIAEDGELSFAEMAVRVATLGARLAAAGVRRGDRVGLLLPNGIRWCAGLLAAHAAGACAVPLNTWFQPEELDGVLRRATPRVILADPEIAVRLAPGHPGVHHWARGADLPAGLPEAASVSLSEAPSAPGDDALLLFTSGSSAEPKAVRLTQAGVVTTAHAVGERQGVVGGDRLWFALPLFFVFGCANALPNALTHAATLCVQERFDAPAALEFIERHRCTVYYGVAPITRALIACEERASRDISSLRTGTANATAEDLRLAIEELGVTDVCNAYGMTEGYGHSTITSHLDPPEVRASSQGRPLRTQQVRVVNADGVPAAPGEQGHIQIRGTITPGYLDAPEQTAAAFDAEGWFRTGDLGILDAEGRMHYVGRSHDMMKVKGINISPAEVETLLVRHEAVDEAFVFGLDTPDGDQSVGAVLVATVPPSGRDALAEEVTAWARERVSGYKVPTTIWVTTADQLPLTPTGKVSKRLLRDKATSGQIEGLRVTG